MIRFQLAGLLVVFSMNLFAQESDTTVVEEDFSMYDDAELADGAKRFATNKVLDQSPNKLISLGYDFQGAHDLNFGVWGSLPESSVRVKSVQGIRINSNFPVISRANVLLNIGVNYWETNYQIESSESHPISSSLQTRGLRTTGVTTTLFKPFNEKRFMLIQFVFDLNGDYFLPDFQSLSYTRVSPTFIYGWKKHDRLMYGFGFSRTYRVGEPNLIPVFMYNYTAPSRKWGIESVFPARANFRRTFNTRTLAFFGYELEGQTYRMSSLKGVEGIVNPELRRSELRIRMTFERSIKNFVWLSAQAGLRYPWNFNLDDGNIFRGFGDTPYTME
ncbi:MAG: DUF6268 family outer membrane beta-barrel protein, partial [Cyclobacteriaceae bacterium]|nr:DUF6268 family outer membrane beta-barrel protein [Cyclobacteriaceae bacterium]